MSSEQVERLHYLAIEVFDSSDGYILHLDEGGRGGYKLAGPGFFGTSPELLCRFGLDERSLRHLKNKVEQRLAALEEQDPTSD